MKQIASRFSIALQLIGLVMVLGACTQSQSVREDGYYSQPGYGQPYPYIPQPYYDPYFGSGYGVTAPPARSDVDVQIERTRTSIHSGVQSGTLTRDEAQQLRGELNTIQHKADRMQRDGYLSKPEQDRLSTDLGQLKKKIKREKEDDERRRKSP